MSEWLTVIGIEVHTQLLTRSKMFCSCDNNYAGDEPNTHVCPVCLGAPGMLPTVNAQALEYGIMAALALDCSVPEFSWFERKNYPYPDLVKGFQLTQYAYPIGAHGKVDLETDHGPRRIGVRRVHLEEDTAKNTHVTVAGESYSLVDCNRAGVPLMEIVTEPDARSSEEAVAYLKKLRDVLVFLGIASGKMEEGAMRLEANISVRTPAEAAAGVLRKRCEVKNLNSFENVRAALEYERERQIAAYEAGEEIQQATLGWDSAAGRTVYQRSKEEAQDYRYFPEPDLPPLRFTAADVDAVRAKLPELRPAIIARYEALGLDRYRAELLSQTRALATYFETALAGGGKVERVANLLLGDLLAQVNERQINLEETTALPAAGELGRLAQQWEAGEVTGPQVKQLLPRLFETGETVDAAKAALGIRVVGGADELLPIIEAVLAANAAAVAKVKAGEQKVMGFLVGQVMKATKGQGAPGEVNRLLAEVLARD
ncbi:MAG: Asp-tRNA(Asn)/Glu-tRNA(Gln) amidotransferase subunit GatB [Fimbriimonadaceae bacterium]|nr:Asp-tRNA(Asn)/Glu-tRNA(Gln) amidotransferase subunit GatB [Fimbriimonadaceae bacterium]